MVYVYNVLRSAKTSSVHLVFSFTEVSVYQFQLLLNIPRTLQSFCCFQNDYEVKRNAGLSKMLPKENVKMSTSLASLTKMELDKESNQLLLYDLRKKFPSVSYNTPKMPLH